MHFEVIDSLSVPGDPAKLNDDAFACEGAGAIVMDGATGLGEPLLDGESDAAWVARFGAERILAHMRAKEDPRIALRGGLDDTQAEFVRLRKRVPAATYEIPFASMMFVSLAESLVQALWFGDCAALVRGPSGDDVILGDAIRRRVAERARVERLAATLGATPARKGVRDIFLPDLRKARNTVNTREGGWLFGPDARAADHVAAASALAPEGTILLLVTDGFLALSVDYERYALAALIDAALSKGLEALGEELRTIEADDPEGRRYPRFKKSDDATALLLRARQ